MKYKNQQRYFFIELINFTTLTLPTFFKVIFAFDNTAEFVQLNK